jgi:hypothetical protein
MKQDPLITYSSLIPGGLRYTPGGLNLPREKRKMNESSSRNVLPAPTGQHSFPKILRRLIVSLWDLPPPSASLPWRF